MRNVLQECVEFSDFRHRVCNSTLSTHQRETSAADTKDDLRVSEAGIRLDQRFYYTVITVDVMPDVADYLPREETTVERGFAGTAFSSGPMEVVEILE